ncbi:hypothetical protein EWB00_007068 [Schistosoma japonicum]|uniref:Uncharacterized protein n=1 Tax=Schistosoma japonicum TaxID=6182 RepID=A0A4Z2DST8_SCHJA|nr:hypothetical protein EWB00_007068 [Schistosoma japonicum]
MEASADQVWADNLLSHLKANTKQVKIKDIGGGGKWSDNNPIKQLDHLNFDFNWRARVYTMFDNLRIG